MSVTAEELVWAFRYFLNREPPAELVAALMVQYQDRDQMRREFAKSLEFRFAVPIDDKKSYALAPFLLPEPVDGVLLVELPSLRAPRSQLCTKSQFEEPIFLRWAKRLEIAPLPHRKNWEWVYICRCLEHHGLLSEGRRALGFGVGTEPISSALAHYNVDVVATDSLDASWTAGNQYAADLRSIWKPGIVAWDVFSRRVVLRRVDMNNFDPGLLDGFDIVWSSCSLEHLGSLRHGMNFIRTAMACLRPGGVAVHTTEFNLSSNEVTIETPGLSVYRRRDIEELVAVLSADGHVVEPLNFFPGSEPLDEHVDLPPYSPLHLKLDVAGFVATSLGLVVRRGG